MSKIDKNSPIAVVLQSRVEVDLFALSLGGLGYRKITSFTSAQEAYDVASRQLFHMFISRVELPDMSGVVLMQKLRETGNYGTETHMFVCDKLDPHLLPLLYEFDQPYVLVKPFNKQSIAKKFQHVLAAEENLSEADRIYRDARAAFYNGIGEMAIEYAQRALKLAPDSEKVLILLGDIAAKQNEPDKAADAYTRALAVSPKSVAAAHKLAQVYMTRGEFKKAADLLNSLAELNPYNICMLENAGLSNYNVDQLPEAESHMRRLTALDPANKTAAEVTANINIRKGDYDGVLKALKKSHSDKEILAFLNNAGVKLSQGDDVEGALKMYQAAVGYLNESKYLFAIYYNMGLAYRKLEDLDKARIYFQLSLRQNPNFEKAEMSLRELKKEAS